MGGRKMGTPFVRCERRPKSQNNQPGFTKTHGKHVKTQTTTHPRGRRPLGGGAEGGAWVIACVSMCFPRVLVNPGGLFWLFGGVLQRTKGFLHFLTTHLWRKS